VANSEAQSVRPILDEEIASQREVKSASTPAAAEGAVYPIRVDPEEGERFVARGEYYLAAGDIAVAREFFLRAADAGIARGALLLASTYDPNELVGPHVVGVQPNIAIARKWYERAEALGEKLAGERLARLERR
jgi:TPR repeat protein